MKSLGLTLVLLVAMSAMSTCLAESTENINVSSVLIKLIEEVEVPAREEGPLREVIAKEGDVVETGALLARLEDDRIRLQRDQAELELKVAATKAASDAALQLAEEELRVAQAALSRARASRVKYPDVPSQAEVDNLELRVAEANFHLRDARQNREITDLQEKLAQKTLAFADYQLERHRIIAPLPGMVVELYARRGDWVKPGDKLARIIRIDRLRAEGFVDVQHASADLVGRVATVIVDVPGKPESRYQGRIVFVSPEADPVNRQTRVWAEIENDGRELKPGLRARMTIDPRSPRVALP